MLVRAEDYNLLDYSDIKTRRMNVIAAVNLLREYSTEEFPTFHDCIKEKAHNFCAIIVDIYYLLSRNGHK